MEHDHGGLDQFDIACCRVAGTFQVPFFQSVQDDDTPVSNDDVEGTLTSRRCVDYICTVSGSLDCRGSFFAAAVVADEPMQASKLQILKYHLLSTLHFFFD